MGFSRTSQYDGFLPFHVSGVGRLFNVSQELGMLQKALALMFALAGIAVCIGCSTESHYLFATFPSANQVAVYREDPIAGVLTQITGSPYSVGDGAHSLVIHPSGKYLYVANPGESENDVSLFNIAGNGVLTEVFPRTTVMPLGNEPEQLVMDPSGDYLYVMNSASENISVFSIDAKTGSLTQLAGSPFPIGLSPLNMQVAPSGKFLFLTGVGTVFTSYIETFNVNSGVLTYANLTPSEGVNPYGLAIDPAGKYLYAGNTSSNSITIFSIGSNGSLTQVAGSPLADIYNGPVALQMDPKGLFLYVANQSSNNVAVYSINTSTGLPVTLTTSTTTFAFATVSDPSVIAFDPNGGHVFIGGQGSSPGIQSFQVTSGNLYPVYTYKEGNSATSMAVTP
jgi:6-phosphogluconolactonase